jgi:hypothetical protein
LSAEHRQHLAPRFALWDLAAAKTIVAGIEAFVARNVPLLGRRSGLDVRLIL